MNENSISLTGISPSDGDRSERENGTPKAHHLPVQSLSVTSVNAPARTPSPQISNASQTEPQDTIPPSLNTTTDSTSNPAIAAPTAVIGHIQPQSKHEGIRAWNTANDRLGSPGVDPKKAIPVSSENTVCLSEPSARSSEAELGSPRASTVHLPPRDVQETSLIEVDQDQANATRRDRREDEKHPPSGGAQMMTAAASTPSSTIGPCSTATPGVNGGSPDTSPGDEVISDAKFSPMDMMQASDVVDNLPRGEKLEHDNLARSQMELARLNALATDPSTPDAQLRLEEARSRLQPEKLVGRGTLAQDLTKESSTVQNPAIQTNHTLELVQNTIVDEDDEVIGVPTPDHEEGMGRPFSGHIVTSGKEDISNVVDWPLQDAEREGLGTVDSQSWKKLSSNHKFDTNIASSSCAQLDLGSSGLATVLEHDATASVVKTGPSVNPTTANLYEVNATAIPKRENSTMSANQISSERMITRVSSGALRHKSVSEILGEAARPNVAQLDRSVPGTGRSAELGKDDFSHEVSSHDLGIHVPLSLTSKVRLGERREREKERSKLSTVIFAKPPFSAKSNTSDLVRVNSHCLQDPSQADKDYLHILFMAQASSQPRTQPLSSLLISAHKTLTTSNHYVDFHEQQDCRILKRIYQLQYSNRWSLRQIERSTEPLRPTTHWDVLLGQMKWMRTDFREERKWKLAAAKNLADWCSEWVSSNAEVRVLLQVRRKPVTQLSQVEAGYKSVELLLKDDGHMERPDTQDPQPTPDLVPSGDVDSSSDGMDEDERHYSYHNTAPPAAIFSLGPEDVTFGLRKTPASDKVLSELPLYEPSRIVPNAELPTSLVSPDAVWKAPCVPISKFTFGKMISIPQEPPRKRSRFDYEAEEERTTANATGFIDESIALSNLSQRSSSYNLPPEQDEIALFKPDNKHTRDRIHAGHAFRPPSEYSMPSQSFFECRQSSQWTWNEDDELRRLVKEYSYNWSLIASCLSSSSLYSSGAERRTPWECFERWVGLEGLPADMSKTQYFRAYHARLEAAQRTLLAQQQAAQQQQGTNPGQPPVRRRTAQPVRVERRKNSKYLALIDAMRKLAKKRESAIQKQQHGTSSCQRKKQHPFASPAATIFPSAMNAQLIVFSGRNCGVQESQRDCSATTTRPYASRLQSSEVRSGMQDAGKGRDVPPASPRAT